MGAEVIEADAELIEKVRDLMAPPEDGESWLESACRAADASAQLTKMKHEMARVILAQSAEIARLREALEPFDRADQSDWDRLLHTLGWSGHDRFWRSVLEDYRRARAALETKG